MHTIGTILQPVSKFLFHIAIGTAISIATYKISAPIFVTFVTRDFVLLNSDRSAAMG